MPLRVIGFERRAGLESNKQISSNHGDGDPRQDTADEVRGIGSIPQINRS